MQAGQYFRKTENGYSHWCPGCEEMHHIWVIPAHKGGPVWNFNDNLEVPTFTPSVRIKGANWDGNPTCCHYFITEGQIRYCSDCTHKLNAQTIPLPPLPEGHRDVDI